MSDLTCTNCGEYVGSPIADRIEELDDIIRHDRERIVELVSMVNSKDARIEELERKLAKALEAMEFWSQAQEPEIDAAINLMQTTLAKLKGETDGR
jgi:PHP family Zn ribbon phosphoesterase